MKLKQVAILLLFIIISVLFRLRYTIPHHPDHFTWGEYTQEIIKIGYAPWVLHPLSLFGYYPLSIPSGFEYFSATVSVLTGLDLPQFFAIMSIITGLIGALNLFALMKHWSSLGASIISAIALSTMAFYAKVTQQTASTRMFNVIFYPLFILMLFKYYKEKKKKHLVLGMILALMMALIHRLSQFLIVYVAAFVGALVIYNWEHLHHHYKKSIFYHKRKKHYEHSKLYYVNDVVFLLALLIGTKLKLNYLLPVYLLIVVGYFIITHAPREKEDILVSMVFYPMLAVSFKILDLALRNRLAPQLAKRVPWMTEWMFYLAFFMVFVFPVLLYMAMHMHLRKIVRKIAEINEKLIHFMFMKIENDTEMAIGIGLVLTLILFFTMSLLGEGLISVDRTPFYSSMLISGRNPPIVLFNWWLNLNNNLTVLIPFAFLGIGYLCLKRKKTVYDYFFVLAGIAFTQVVFDWEYARLYMNPLYAVFIGVGLTKFYEIFSKRWKRLSAIGLVLVLIVHFGVSSVFVQRDEFISGGSAYYVPNRFFVAAAKIFTNSSKSSIVPSSNFIRINRLSYYSDLYNAVIVPELYPDRYAINITSVSFSPLGIIDAIKSGKKIRSLSAVKDWIFIDNYYHGRHIFYFTSKDFYNKRSQYIKEIYSIDYIASSEKIRNHNGLYYSIYTQKNKFYNSGDLNLFDLNKGR